MQHDQDASRRDAADLDSYFDGAPTVGAVAAELETAFREAQRHPDYVADKVKGSFVADVMAAMKARGLNKKTLAERMGKSRQYVTRALNEKTNFTIERMAEFACALDMPLSIALIEPRPWAKAPDAAAEDPLH